MPILGKFHKVTAINNFGEIEECLPERVDTLVFNAREICPIKLTPEIFGRAGVGIKLVGKDTYQIGKYRFGFDDMQLYEKNSVGMIYNVAKVQYLHQLQNVIFALTGSPLKISL